MMDPLSIQNEMKQFDLKRRDFYDSLEEELKRKFAPYLMIRWGSSVEGSRELQEFYVIATNERVNRHFFSVNAARHKKLLWLLATTVSPDMGVHRHTWIAAKKKESSGTKRKHLKLMFPTYKDDEIDVMSKIVTDKDIRQWFRNHGQEPG